MFPHLVVVLAVIVIAALFLPLFFYITNKAAFLQKPGTLVIRQNGSRWLGTPLTSGTMAREDLPFAQISEAVYHVAEAVAKNETAAVEASSTEDQPSGIDGWVRWGSFFAASVQAKFSKHNLRVEICENAALQRVVVAFGGTNAKNIQDWIANLRWFIPHHDDEYTLVVKELGRLFANELVSRCASGKSVSGAMLFATGHSLGGGLAQEFAYSLPQAPAIQRVSKVYAFDASPVTGFFSVKKSLRDVNRKGLAIDRIYERREILAITRSIINLIHPPGANNPQIREIRYNFKEKWNPIYRHSISRLISFLQETAQGA